MSEDAVDRPAFEHSGHAVAEQGMVLLDGPDGIAIALTPDAALQTGESLIAAAHAARLQASQTEGDGR
jgi:hypothetical protein